MEDALCTHGQAATASLHLTSAGWHPIWHPKLSLALYPNTATACRYKQVTTHVCVQAWLLTVAWHPCIAAATSVVDCAGINKLLEQHPVPEGQYTTWIDSINEVREKFPMWYPEKDDVIIPQWAIQVCCAQQLCASSWAQSGCGCACCACACACCVWLQHVTEVIWEGATPCA